MKAQQDISIVFSDVIGLEVGDKIVYRGMEAGRIKKVELHPEGILCKGRISSTIQIPEGSLFYIEDSLMGSKTLKIIPSESSNTMDLRKVQRGESPIAMMSMIGKVGETLKKLDSILAAIETENGILTQGEILLSSTTSAVNAAKGNMGELKKEISNTISRVDQLTTQINNTVSHNKSNVEEAIAMAPDAISKVNTTLDSLQALSGKLNRSVKAISSGSGTAGKLITEDELYTKMMLSIENLDMLIKDVKANPKKYVKFSLF